MMPPKILGDQLRSNETMQTLGVPDATTRELVDEHLEMTAADEAHVSNEASFKFEEGAVAVCSELASVIETKLDDLVFRPMNSRLLSQTSKELGVLPVLNHFVDGSEGSRGRSLDWLVLGMNRPDDKTSFCERLGAVGGNDKNIREELAEVGIDLRHRFINDRLKRLQHNLECISDLARVASFIHDHLANRGPEPENSFEYVYHFVVAHDLLLCKKQFARY